MLRRLHNIYLGDSTITNVVSDLIASIARELYFEFTLPYQVERTRSYEQTQTMGRRNKQQLHNTGPVFQEILQQLVNQKS